MNESEKTRISKFLSLVLRHEPGKIGITLDASGWVEVEELLQKMGASGKRISRDILRLVVSTNEKKRFEFSADERHIRASQGHSVEVDLGYTEKVPPEILYHGTAARFVEMIREKGLLKMDRHDVHLSAEAKMTLQVGARRGSPALLTILAGEMHRAGMVFKQSTNGVWLTEEVPPQYIVFP
ncbi:MAG: RNA 2'-phosphotransferase [Verrucomicrobiota bacterium]